MKVELAYGNGSLPVEFPDGRTTVIRPTHVPGMSDERGGVIEALDHPISSPALRQRVGAVGNICILFTDSTRATPNERLIPWLLDYLSDAVRSRITLLNQTGTHRSNRPDELRRMLGPGVFERCQVLNHDAHDRSMLARVGTLRDGAPALLNRWAVEADLRIVTGFIEPHFFAGFSGGPKGLIPGVAGLETVMSNHGSRNISHPNATFGVTVGNPLWEELRDIALLVGPSFLLNVTLNEQRRITGVFAGDLVEAHGLGCEFARGSAMQKVDAPFDVVVTTNSGHPLDLNLYQGVKGMSAAARIVKDGGTILLACECCEGVPAGSPYDRLLRSAPGPSELLAALASAEATQPEQWQAQIQAQIQRRARVLLYSVLPDESVRAAHLEPCHDLQDAVLRELARHGPLARVAVLPQGPLTIPYLG